MKITRRSAPVNTEPVTPPTHITQTWFAYGSYATVHTVPGLPGYAAKIFKNVPRLRMPQSPAYRNAKLQAMMQLLPPREPTRTRLAWPTETVKDAQGTPIGYIMPKAPQGTVTLMELCETEGRESEKRHAADLLQEAVTQLHRQEFVIGDISAGNTALSPDGTLWIYDCDSWQFTDPENGFLYYASGTTDRYIHPMLRAGFFGQVNPCANYRCPNHGVSHITSLNCRPRTKANDRYAVACIRRELGIDDKAPVGNLKGYRIRRQHDLRPGLIPENAGVPHLEKAVLSCRPAGIPVTSGTPEIRTRLADSP